MPIQVRSWGKRKFEPRRTGVGVTTNHIRATSVPAFLANMRHSAEAISRRLKRVKIGAKVVSHGRYVTFQLAEVAVPKELFQKILRLIDGLRPAPLPP